MKITIDGSPYEFSDTCTILKACEEHGISVPTLCHDPRTEPFTSCFLCVVEVEGARGFVPACATKIREGMAINTNTDAIRKTRKLALELLLSDHAGDCLAPCRTNCPAGIDIQGYLAHVANKDYHKAIQLIKQANPLPIVCGRVCPKPCEDGCRRNLLDEAVAVDNVKRFVADWDVAQVEPYRPHVAADNGKSVAVVGAGPAGLTCAYYLRIAGYSVDVFEATDRPGGMLEWGIPEYRLPHKTLMKEVDGITAMGVRIYYNTRLGKDIKLGELRKKHNAVFLAIGAQNSTDMRIDNERTIGVFGGINFLAEVVKGNTPDIGNDVVVVGGGNTAIDAARTAIRLGAKNVTIVYRRTREQMPAEAFEVHEADIEGVQFCFLRAPQEVVVSDGRVAGLRCQVMKLGEPDSSGRCKPIVVEGEMDVIPASCIIAAIGQAVDSECLAEAQDGMDGDRLELTRWNTIAANEAERSFATNLPGVFAGGDVVTGPSIAVSAIAHGQYAAKAIDAYLQGVALPRDFRKDYMFSLGQQLKQVDKAYVPQMPIVAREKNTHLAIEKRKMNFDEVEYTFSEEQAVREAGRCLGCGCLDHAECSLRKYAQEYEVNPAIVSGLRRSQNLDTSAKYMVFDSAKCIKCGKCVRICDEIKGVGALGFVGRGFNTNVLPPLEEGLSSSSCVQCGQCEVVCPTGAIADKPLGVCRLAQFDYREEKANCRECSMGCETVVSYLGHKPVKVTPAYRGTSKESMMCRLGRYEYLENPQVSCQFDIARYKTMGLTDLEPSRLDKVLPSLDFVFVADVDVLTYYAPAGAALKRYLDCKDGRARQVVYFTRSHERNLRAFHKYSNLTHSVESSCLRHPALEEAVESGKEVLVFVEETSLTAAERDYFMAFKGQKNVLLLNLVQRRNMETLG